METGTTKQISQTDSKTGLTTYIRAMRPEHWVKNLLVLAAFFFALGDEKQAAVLLPLWLSACRIVGAAVFFCVVSSAIYLLNDIKDLELDRAHPQKRLRPIAAGLVPLSHAWALAVALLAIGIAGSVLLSPYLAAVVVAYVLLQALYTLLLKKVAMLDVLVIASGFVLRALAGAETLTVQISPWLVLCTFLLALFLGFCKRRHEKIMIADNVSENRPSLINYNERLLDQVIGITAAATIVSYSVYTLSRDTVDKFGTSWLGFSIPFVIFGIFRYLDLVYRHERGNKPERLLLTDKPLFISILLYALVVLIVALKAHFRSSV
jgi:4-hydroxybenzoate polyprenyltransferase